MKYLFALVAGFLMLNAVAQTQTGTPSSPIVVRSPDKTLEIRLYQKADGEGKKALYYQVSYQDRPVILESLVQLELDNNLSEKAMALKVDGHKHWFENLAIKKITTLTKDTTWTPVCGERAAIPDHYNETVVSMVKDDNTIYDVNLEVRAYNEGAALRFYFPENSKGTYYNITADNTEFAFAPGAKAWFANWAQAPYQLLPLKDWPGESERPLTIHLANGLYVSLAEAQMVDFARAKFKLSDSKANTVVASMFGGAQLISPFATPWRTILVGERPGDLIERNYLLLNLNEPAKIATSWITPGKIMRVASLTTADAKANIDFAVQQHLQHVLFDCGWYGPPFSFNSDATKVAIPNFDLPEILRYAKEKGIGVWLYVNQQGLLAQSDSLFAVYKKWGVKGVKFGFVQAGSHRWTTWIEKAIQQAAANKIMVNIHDDWRPTGEQRTWPNLMTAEGIRGNEEMPDATHNTVLPFTRFIAGPADYTICYFNKRIKTTHAHQLALAAVYYSPIQTLFWYDKPAMYHNEPELEFWRKIPTTWDETRIIDGTPGEFVVTARRKGGDWFIGAITGNEPRTLKIPLSFLAEGKSYEASIYADDTAVKTNTHVSVTKIKVDRKTVLQARLKPSGGEAIHLSPLNE